jgi:aconitate hydratase
VEAYAKEQGLFRENQVPEFSEVLELDMSTVEPSLAGPKRPQDRIPLAQMKPAFLKSMEKEHGVSPSAPGAQVVTEGPVELFPDSEVAVEMDGKTFSLTHGSVVIASITSCTNTSNPSVMLGAGILAKKAVEPCPRFARGNGIPGKSWADGIHGGAALPSGRIWLRHLYR